MSTTNGENHHHRIGQRLSYDGVLCTVRFIGPVAGTTGTWLGVEWDDASRGKHDGSHKGLRYFSCLSSSATPASFVRPTRPAEHPTTFLDALREKYAGQDATATDTGRQQVVISGKVAEEVGFDKIRRQQAQLGELRIVILDGMRILDSAAEESRRGDDIREVCPKVVELDLSRNLFTGFGPVVDICRQLPKLRGLRLNGNRFQNVLQDSALADQDAAASAFQGVKELAVDETLLRWEEICHIAARFPSLTTLYASTNQLSKLSRVPASWPPTAILTSIYLEYNDFTSLADVASLASLAALKNLYLKGNKISTMLSSSDTAKDGDAGADAPPSLPVFSETLTYLDISYNKIHHWFFVDALPDVFPGLTSLRLAHNPVYDNSCFSSATTATATATTTTATTTTATTTTAAASSTVTEEAYMITVARLAALRSLNFSAVTPTDRTNAEMFYLSRIGRQLASVPEADEHAVVARQHRRYAELCALYGAPVVVRRQAVNPAFLEARLIEITFRFLHRRRGGEGEAEAEETTKTAQIPKTFDIYAVKGIAGRLFGHEPLRLKLVWETGEWDPVAGFDEGDGAGGDNSSSDEEEEGAVGSKFSVVVGGGGVQKQEEEGRERENKNNSNSNSKAGRWIKREVELTDSPRQFGFCVDGMDVTVRVEPR